MSAMRSYHDEVRERLLDFWLRREEYGPPLGCVATSYTFDAAFFEEDCLGRLVGMETQPDEDQRSYLVEREERLAQVGCVVLVDASQVPRSRSLRWHLLSVRVPGGGIQHAKVTALVWERRVRVLVGSANLTEYGYRRNFEHLGVLDFTPEGAAPLSLLDEVLGFLERMAGWAAGNRSGSEGPQSVLRRLIRRTRDLTSRWEPAEPRRGEAVVRFLGLAPGTDRVFAQLAARWTGTGADEAVIVSPFYDDGSRARLQVDGLLEAMGKQGDRSVEFQGRGRRLQDGRVELEIPEALRNPWRTRTDHRFRLVRETDGESDLRPLHAKSLWLERGDRALFMIGSSNFTCAGYGTGDGPRNVEANLVYVPPKTADPFAKKCEAAYPDSEALDLESSDVAFLAETPDRTPEGDQYTPLPAGFGEALFRPVGEAGVVLLELGRDLPARFVVLGSGGEELLTGAAWEQEGRPGQVERRWAVQRPPSSLEVVWTGADGEEKRSLWVVNVTDPAALPPPEELRDLSLEVLVEILTSARPLHESLSRIRRGLEQMGDRPLDVVFDPHRKVDTRNYLLRRVRRISGALEGLRQRLERPAYDIDALRWRLEGPVGPVKLARKLAAEEGEGAGFMIAEVALALTMTDWTRVNEHLTRKVVRQEVGKAVETLRALASERPSPANLEAYVRDSFAKVDEWFGQ